MITLLMDSLLGKETIERVLYEEDTFSYNDLIDSTTLNENGEFHVSGYLEDPWFHSECEPYIRGFHQCGHPGKQCVMSKKSLKIEYYGNPGKFDTVDERADVLAFEKMYHKFPSCDYVREVNQPYTNPNLNG
ncbi:unnamed protein product [Bursaphelenchus okinawaensis]|uniref:Uncharacterized protein n=1 Tax=Bursaphelenchus okinawaensis TaxID=465554 RepID=A0A811KSP5_9BILA|nr:unnamed protein product [Bursaphelenchus okinawaensis]CAG9110147.1 unnamed protein product [Bursaphelenchus okinawaensis]